jgi:hypothetical protein
MEKLQSTTQSLPLRVHSENANFQYRNPSSVFKNPRKIESSNKDIYNYLQNQVWIRSCLYTLWRWFSSEIAEVVVCLWGEFAHSQSNLSNICVRKKKKFNPKISFAIHKTQHNPTKRSREKRGAHALEFVRSAAKRSSDSRASAPLRGRSESGLAYPLRPDSSLTSPQHTNLHKTLDTSPTARSVAPCAKNHSPVHHPRGFTTQPKNKLKRPHSFTVLLGAPQPK